MASLDPLDEIVDHYRDRMLRPMKRRDAIALLEDVNLRIVGQEVIKGVKVSTVHLVVGHPCHGPHEEGDLEDGRDWDMDAYFETMTFDDEVGGDPPEEVHFQRRYHTLLEAMAGHAESVAKVKEVLGASDPEDPLEGFREVR